MNALRVAEDYRLGLGEGGCLSFHLSASPCIQIRLKGGCKVKYTGAARYAFVQPYQKRRAEPFGSARLFWQLLIQIRRRYNQAVRRRRLFSSRRAERAC